MKLRGKIVLATTAAVCALSAAQANAATIINVSATASGGTTLFLEAGNYVFDFIGTAQGGAYNAWRFSNALYGCNSSGSNCTRGWLMSVALDLGNSGGIFNRTNGYYYWQVPQTGQNHYYATAQGALAQAATSPFLTSPLTVPAGYVRPATAVGPFSFTLTTAQNVNFFIKDSVYTDNVGGISLSLRNLAAVPEPGTWAMMLAGFGLVGFAMRRRNTRVAVSYN